MRLYAHRAPWRQLVEFYLVDDRPAEDWHHPQPHLLQRRPDGTPEWARQPEGFAFAMPSFDLTDDAAQELFEGMWAGGFRPKAAVNEASRIEAVNRHLEDMRAIAFDRLKVKEPNSR